MKCLLCACLIWFSCDDLLATAYFISSKGNDQNSGKSKSEPWRSLAKVNESSAVFVPGDSILFERGNFFEGTLLVQFSGQKGKEIYIGSYGTGSSPVVSGATEASNWKAHAPNIWVCDFAALPANVFVNGKLASLGRYPNTGYRTLQNQSKSDRSFSDNSLPFSDGHWDNAEVVVKSSRWTLDKLSVKSFRDKIFNLANAASYPIPDGFGYFIQKHISTLDREGEWFYDPQAHKVYLYTAAEPKKVIISNIGHGLKATNIHDVVIEGLEFRYQAQEGVALTDSERIAMKGVRIAFAGHDGMHVTGCQTVIVENCRIADSGNNGVEWRNNIDGSFSKNKIIRSGLVPGQGSSGNGTYIALSISNNLPMTGRNVFQLNTIDSTGYLGVDFRSGSTRIINNIVSNFCMLKDDGAGIYTWGNEQGGNVIEGNIVLHGRGSGEGTSNPTQRYAHGIYIDDRSADIVIKSNTVAYCASSGIFIHNARRVEISANTLFGNGTSLLNREKGQLFVKRDGIVNMTNELGLRVQNNILVSTDDVTPCLLLGGNSNDEISSLGLVEKNSFAAPRAQQAISKLVRQGMCDAPIGLTLGEWQKTGFDGNSTFSPVPSAGAAIGSNLVRNGTMSSRDGWIAWPDKSVVEQDRNQLLDGPSLRVAPSSDAAEVLLYQSGFALKTDKTYKISFMARTDKPSQLQFVPMMAADPWLALSDYACFSTSSQPQEFFWYFKPDRNFNQVRANFKSNGEFWIDNVRLQEVDANGGLKAPVKLLYNSTPKTIELNAAGSANLKGAAAGVVSLPPFESLIVINNK
jgi:parallel beta-helix repeat protein